MGLAKKEQLMMHLTFMGSMFIGLGIVLFIHFLRKYPIVRTGEPNE